MTLATRGNVRTAAAALTGSMPKALTVAFRTGGVAGMFTVGLGLLGATVIIMIFQNTSSAILIGFGFGGSLLALFLRVGGGIFTKAADVGADLVGKVEAGIPEDDPRNPATIADNVGDNVGDCAGMAADLFESYEVTLVASIILGVAAFNSIGMNPALGLIFPLAARAIGVVASIAGVFAVKAKRGRDQRPASRSTGASSSPARSPSIGTLLVALLYVGNDEANAGWKCFGAVAIGLVLAQLISRLTEYYTGTEHDAGAGDRRVRRDRPGHRRAVRHVERPGELGVRRHRHRHRHRRRAGPRRRQPHVLALPRRPHRHGHARHHRRHRLRGHVRPGVSDNAAGIAEMSGEFHGEPERIMVSLDAVGNTTKAVTKGFAIGSAVIAAVALFASFIETAGAELGLVAENLKDGVLRLPELAINVAEPKIFIGLLIGGAVPFLFSALAIRAVGRTAGVVVQEVRSQFADGKIMAGTKKPDYGPVIDICTAASLRELATPALLAVLTPVDHRLRHRLAGARRLPRRRHPRRPADGQLPEQRRRRLGQRQEVHRGRPPRRQGLRRPQGRRHRRHRRRPVQGHRRPGAQPADQGDEPGVAADAAGDHQLRGRRAAARFVVAGVSLVVLIGAVIWSSRKTGRA